MPPKCTICAHKKREQIDRCVLRGESTRPIASQFNVGYKSLQRHINAGHVSEAVAIAEKENKVQQGLDLQKCAKEIYELAFESAKDAKKAKQFGAIGSCLAPAAKVIDILSKGEPQNINLNMSTDSDLDAKLERLIQKRKA